MRFETSQTTPSFLDRRIQLRMLSFVGMISIAMFFLAFTNRSSTTDAAKNQAVSPDSLTFEPIVENRTLKPDEVIILGENEHNGPRGQWGDEAERTAATDDEQPHQWELFKSRAQEREDELKFFSRRTRHFDARPDIGLEPRQDRTLDEFPEPISVSLEERAATEERAVDQEESNPAVEWDDQPASPPLSRKPVPDKKFTPEAREEEPTGILSDLIFRKRADEEEKKSLLPDQTDRETEKFEQPVRPRKDLPPVEAPVREPETSRKRERERDVAPPASPSKKRVINDIATVSPDPRFDLSDETPPKSNPLRERPDRTPSREDRDNIDTFDQFTTETPRSNPVAPRREPTYGREPAYEDDPVVAPGRDRDLWIGKDAAFGQEVATVQIEKRYLDPVKDNTMGIRKDEAESFYWLLDHAHRVPARKLDAAGLKEVQYINLMTEPDRFRGEPITIEGDLWRLYEFDAGENTYGVNRMYEGWVFTGDSANHPYRIVCTSLPKGIEPGENLRIPVRLTGYFYKLEGYRSNGGVHIAPTMLAKRIKINPMPNGIPMMSGVVPYLLGAIMAVGIALLVTTVGFAIGDERSMRGLIEQRRRHPTVSFANVVTPTLVPVEQALRQYAERERQTAISGAYGPLMNRQTIREYGLQSPATSRQLEIDSHNRESQQRHDAVHDWVARQKTVAAESRTAATKKHQTLLQPDELESSAFEVARHRVTAAQPFDKPNQSIPNPPPLAQAQAGTMASSRPSALSEWEAEASRLSHQTEKHPHTSRAIAAEQIERDHLAREREIRQRIARQQAEAARIAQEQLDRERLEMERLERERQWYEQQERDRVERERSSFPEADSDSTNYSLSPAHSAKSHAEQERLRHELIERERQERQRLERDIQERERRERERRELDRIESERLERERIERERRSNHASQSSRSSSQSTDYGDEFEDDSLTSSSTEHHLSEDDEPKTKKKRGGGWGWPQRRKSSQASESSSSTSEETESSSYESTRKRKGGWGWPRRPKNNDGVESTELTDQTESDDDSSSESGNTGNTSFGWGRSRKRRRHLREDEST